MSDLFETDQDDLFGNSGEDFSTFLQQPMSKPLEHTELVSEMHSISLSEPAVDSSTTDNNPENDPKETNNQPMSFETVKEEPNTLQEFYPEPVNDLDSTGDDLFGGSSDNTQDFGSMIMQSPIIDNQNVPQTQEIVPPTISTQPPATFQESIHQNILESTNSTSSPPPPINTSFPPVSASTYNQLDNSGINKGGALSPPPLRSTSSTSSISSRNRYVNSFGTQSRSTFTLPVSIPPTSSGTNMQSPTSTGPQFPPVNGLQNDNLISPYGNASNTSVMIQPPTNGSNPMTQQTSNHSMLNDKHQYSSTNNSLNTIPLNNRSAVMEGYSSPPFHGRQTPTQVSTGGNMVNNNILINPMSNMGMLNNPMNNPMNPLMNNQPSNYINPMNQSMGNMGIPNNDQMMNNYGIMNNGQMMSNAMVNPSVNNSSNSPLMTNNMNNSLMINHPYSNNNSMNQYVNPMMNNSMIQRSMSPSYHQNQIISRQILEQEIELRKTYPKPIFCFSFGGKIITSLPTINPHSQPSNTFIHQQRTQALHYQPGLFNIQKLNQLINYRSSIIKSLEDYPITNISQQFDENNSNNINILLDQLVKYMNLKIYEKQQTLIQDNDEKYLGEKMLWDLVKIVSKYVNGNVNMVTSDVNSLLTVLINNIPTELPINSENEQTSFNEAEHVASIQTLLINGQIKQACQYAQTNKMWSHAILLSSMIDKQTYQQVVSTFARFTLNLGSPLRTLYCTFAGKPFEAFESNSSVSVDQYGNQYTLQTSQNEQQQLEKMSSQWLQNLSIMFNNRQGATSQSVIEKIGDMLWKDCYQVPQSHFCYMAGDLSAVVSAFTIASNYQATYSNQASKENVQQQSQQAMVAISNILSTSIVNKRVILLGGDNKRDLRHYINEETIQLSEIFELLKAIITKNCLTAVQEQNVPPISMIINSSLLTYKLVYAYYLAEFGYLEKANECCDYLIEIVKRTQQTMKFNNYFKLYLQELKNRITECNRLNNIIVPQKRATSGVGNNSGVTGWFMKGLESIIHGGESPTGIDNTTTLIQTNVVNTNSMLPNNNVSVQQSHYNNIGQVIQGNPIRSSTPTNITSPQAYQSIQTPPPSSTPQINNMISPQSYQSAQTPPLSNTPPPSSTPPVNNQSASNNNSAEEGSSVGGWFKSLWGGKTSKKEANIGKKNEYYFDEKLKRWVRRGQENEVETKVQAPPPSISRISATTLQSAASQMRGGAGRYVNMFSSQQQPTTNNPPTMGSMPPMMPPMGPPMSNGMPPTMGSMPPISMPNTSNIPPSTPPTFFNPNSQ